MTKLEKLFSNLRWECKRHIETWGFEENIGFNSILTDEVPMAYTKDLRQLRKMIDTKFRGIDINVKLCIYGEEKATRERQILSMMLVTVNNTGTYNSKGNWVPAVNKKNK